MLRPARILEYSAPQYDATVLPLAVMMALMLSELTAAPPSCSARIASETTKSSLAAAVRLANGILRAAAGGVCGLVHWVGGRVPVLPVLGSVSVRM